MTSCLADLGKNGICLQASRMHSFEVKRNQKGQKSTIERSSKWFSPTVGRHVPGSQPPFSLIPDPDQNKEDASLISAVSYGVYIPLSRPIQFCPLPSQNFEKNAQDPGDPAEPWIQDPSGFLPIFMGFKSFHQINLPSYKTL